MRFLNPSGLWLLLGVPLLILIHIICSRHEERAVSSTFLWKLSSRFMKKRIPLQKFRKILLFICQLLSIILVSLLVARPAIMIEGGEKEYVLILDGSASMLVENDDGESRFERAIEQMQNVIADAPARTPVSIILASDDASYLIQRSESEIELQVALRKAECSYGEGDMDGAMELAQYICDDYYVTDVILFSDHEYQSAENITVWNMAEEEWNLSITGLSYTRSKGVYTFTGTVISYGKDCTATFALAIDGSILDAQIVECVSGAETTVTFTTEDVEDFQTVGLYTETEDGLEADNSYYLCEKISVENNILVVSASPFYLENVFNAIENCNVTVVSSLEEAELSGYSLYVFDGCTPESYPTDGSIWIFNPNTAPEDMVILGTVSEETSLKFNRNSESEAVAALTAKLVMDDAYVSSYVRMAAENSWETVITAGTDSVLYTRKEESGMRTMVVGFDLHHSNVPMLADYVILAKNMLDYSVPMILSETDQTVGTAFSLSVLPLCESFYITTPNGTMTAYETDSSYVTYNPSVAGIYTAVQTLENGMQQTVEFYSHIAKTEALNEKGADICVNLEKQSTSDSTTDEGLYEIWFWIAVALLMIILLEWGVYYYEQF